jgi:hypothetical protein
MRLLLLFSFMFGSFLAGCSADTHGNRRSGRPLLTRASDLAKVVGRPVTLVGTARVGDATAAAIDLRGGTVELPSYAWPADYVGRTVTVSGTLFADDGPKPKGAERVYRLGEIESASRWSR